MDRSCIPSLRKVIESRVSFPNDEALINAVLFNIAQHLQEMGDASQNWKAGLNRFTILFDERAAALNDIPIPPFVDTL